VTAPSGDGRASEAEGLPNTAEYNDQPIDPQLMQSTVLAPQEQTPATYRPVPSESDPRATNGARCDETSRFRSLDASRWRPEYDEQAESDQHNPSMSSRPAPAAAAAPPSVGEVRLGLWGAPLSGKTTFLASLTMAVQEPVRGYSWRMSGRDDPSTKFIIDTATDFVEHREFPDATKTLSTLRWKITGVVETPKRRRFRRVKAHSEPDVSFVFEVLEAPGGATANRVDAPFRAEVQEHLRSAKGIVYLFDPVAAATAGENDPSSFTFFFAMLQRLTSSMDRSDELVQGHLPHYVAVCVTKFDDPLIFKPAMKAGYVVQSTSDSLPQVPEHLAEEYFRFVGKDDRSKRVRQLLGRYFLPERVRYFATSAAGFHLDENGAFVVGDFENTRADEAHPGRKLLRSAPSPINVLEPIVWLERQVSGRSERS
jgi:hypothetical protein